MDNVAYCGIRFDSDHRSNQLIIAIIMLCYGNYAHCTLYRSCLLIYRIAIMSKQICIRVELRFPVPTT